MISLRFWALIVGFWFLELICYPLFPGLNRWVDPLFLLLVFISFKLPSTRSLWMWGAFLGFLKDSITGGLWGANICSFALVGWLLGISRHWFEWEDPLMQGTSAALLIGLNSLVYGIIVVWADPMVHWNGWWWLHTALAMGISGICAVWGFPRMQQWCRVPCAY